MLPALGHDWDEGAVTKEAVCEEAGEKLYTCQREECTVTYTEEIKALEHQEVKVEAKAASCEETGNEAWSYCAVCGNELIAKVELPMLGHDWTEGELLEAASCEEAGSREYNYKRVSCNETETREVPALGHSL